MLTLEHWELGIELLIADTKGVRIGFHIVHIERVRIELLIADTGGVGIELLIADTAMPL